MAFTGNDSIGFANPIADFSDVNPEFSPEDGAAQSDLPGPRLDRNDDQPFGTPTVPQRGTVHEHPSSTSAPNPQYRGGEYSLSQKIRSRLTDFWDERIMKSWTIWAVIQLWCFTEFLLIWVTVYTIVRVDYIPPGWGFVLLFFAAIKTVIFAIELLFSATNEGEPVHQYSLHITVLQQLIWDPLMEIPFTAIVFEGRKFDWCWFSWKVMTKHIVLGRLWIGVFSVAVIALKWAIQIRHCWVTGDFFSRKIKVGILSALAVSSCLWLFGFRYWYLQVSYIQPVCYFARMVKVVPETEAQYQVLLEMEEAAEHLDHQPVPIILFCHQPRGVGHEVIIQILQSKWNEFKHRIQEAGMDYELIKADVSKQIAEERKLAETRRKFKSDMEPNEFDFTKYHPLDELVDFLHAVAKKYPMITKLHKLNEKTSMGKDLEVMQISPCFDPDFGWRENSENPSSSSDILTTPIPWTSSKTPKIISATETTQESRTQNSTKSASSRSRRDPIFDWNNLCGPNRQAIWIDMGIHAREWVTPAVGVWTIYELVSKYSQEWGPLHYIDWYIMPVFNPDGYEYTWETYWMYPYGFAEATFPDDTHELVRFIAGIGAGHRNHSWISEERVAHAAVESIEKVNGTKYRVGTAPELLYVVSGDASDWAKLKGGVKYSYSIELRPRFCMVNSQGFGFLLAQDQIVPTAKETFAGFVTVAKEITRVQKK